jgi:hypothetical protein
MGDRQRVEPVGPYRCGIVCLIPWGTEPVIDEAVELASAGRRLQISRYPGAMDSTW